MGARPSTLPRAALGVAVAALVVLTSTLWWSPSASEQPPTAAEEHPPRTGAGAPGRVVVEARPARRAGAVRREEPLAVALPSGRVVGVRAVSSRTDGVLDVPTDIEEAGWWRGGSGLGDPFGSTLLAAHVDSRSQGLGPFAELLHARRGDTYHLASATLRQSFTATSVRVLDRATALRQRWIHAPSGDRRLVMVTCAPPYLPEDGGYQRLLVVTARPASAPAPRER